MTTKIIAASIGYTDTSQSPQGQTLYVATEGFTTDSTDTPATAHFEGRLSGDISYKWTVQPPFTNSRAQSGFGVLSISNNDGGLDSAVNWEFRDGAIVIKMLDPGQDWADGTVIATALGDRAEIQDMNTIRLIMLDPAAILDQPLQANTFTLLEAPDAEDKLKPYAFGTPLTVSAVLVDEDEKEYWVHEYTISELDNVKENGAAVDFEVTDNGFTLVDASTGKITADPIAGGTSNVEGLDAGVIADGGVLSNLNRTLKNPEKSPGGLIDMTASATLGRAASAGGKYYFEVFVNAYYDDTAGAEYPDGSWGIAGGISNSQPANPHRINNADEYAFWCTDNNIPFAPSGDRGVDTYRDGTLVDELSITPLGLSTFNNEAIGVLVDFDLMRVQFQMQGANIGTALAITANSPLDTFYPVIACSGQNLIASEENIASLYLQDEKFAHTVPSGYVSWGGSAYAGATSFTEFVTSITDKITGLTVDTASQAVIDAIGYSYAYYVNTSKTAASVLFEGCASHSGWYYIDRTGSLAFGRIAEPGVSTVADFTEAEIISIDVIKTDLAKGLSNRMGALRNWSPISSSSIDSTVEAADRVSLSDKYQFEVTSSNALSASYNHALGGELLPTYFRVGTDATAEIDRLTALYASERMIYTVDVAFDLDQFAAMTLGDTVSVTISRYGNDGASGTFSSAYSSGFLLGETTKMLVLGIEGSFSKNNMRLTLWG